VRKKCGDEEKKKRTRRRAKSRRKRQMGGWPSTVDEEGAGVVIAAAVLSNIAVVNTLQARLPVQSLHRGAYDTMRGGLTFLAIDAGLMAGE
jgi:hypothetical protein